MRFTVNAEEYRREAHLRRQGREHFDFSRPFVINAVIKEELIIVDGQARETSQQLDVKIVYFSVFVHFLSKDVQKYTILDK